MYRKNTLESDLQDPAGTLPGLALQPKSAQNQRKNVPRASWKTLNARCCPEGRLRLWKWCFRLHETMIFTSPQSTNLMSNGMLLTRLGMALEHRNDTRGSKKACPETTLENMPPRTPENRPGPPWGRSRAYEGSNPICSFIYIYIYI